MKRMQLSRLFQKKQENEFIRVKLAIMLNFHHEKVAFLVFMSKM